MLVMIIIVAALGLRSGLLVGAAIPTSFLISFLVLNGMGMTLNLMIMFAMLLAVGILVDGPIIVVEYADRKMTEGEPRAKPSRKPHGACSGRSSAPRRR